MPEREQQAQELTPEERIDRLVSRLAGEHSMAFAHERDELRLEARQLLRLLGVSVQVERPDEKHWVPRKMYEEECRKFDRAMDVIEGRTRLPKPDEGIREAREADYKRFSALWPEVDRQAFDAAWHFGAARPVSARTDKGRLEDAPERTKRIT